MWQLKQFRIAAIIIIFTVIRNNNNYVIKKKVRNAFDVLPVNNF